MWSVKVKSISKKDDFSVEVVCSFTDGTQVIEKIITGGLGFTEEWLRQQLRTVVTQLQNMDGEIAKVPLNKSYDVSKTQDEKDAEKKRSAQNDIIAVKTDLSLGLITQAQADTKITAITKKLKS